MNKYILDKDAKKNDLDLLIDSIAMSQEAILISNDKILKKLAKLEPRFKYKNWINL